MERLIRAAEDKLSDPGRTEEMSVVDVMLALSGFEIRRYDRIWTEADSNIKTIMRSALTEHDEDVKASWYRRLAPWAVIGIGASIAGFFGADRTIP